MSLAEIINIITALGVVGTLILGFMNQSAIKKSEREARMFNLAMIDYEKRRDFLLIKIAEYIALLDAHKLSFMALSDDEYEGKDIETYKHYYKLETCCYEIKLFLNSDNQYFGEFLDTLDESLSTSNKLRQENSLAEMISSGLRNPEEYASAYNGVKNASGVSDETSKETFIYEATQLRDQHLREFLLMVGSFSNYKNTITDIARKYLTNEKQQVTGGTKQ